MDNPVLILQPTFHKDKLAARDHQALTFIEIGRDDDISNAGLIFHGEKDESLGCAWTLPGDDTTSRAYIFAVFAILQLTCSQYILFLQFLPAKIQRMPSDSQPSAGVVRAQPLFRIHLP